MKVFDMGKNVPFDWPKLTMDQEDIDDLVAKALERERHWQEIRMMDSMLQAWKERQE